MHTGSFDALLVISAEPAVELAPLLPLLARGGDVLLACTTAASLSLPPRGLQERRLSVLGPLPNSRKETLQMLTFIADAGFTWPASEGAFDVAGVNAALNALADAPGGRSVLLQAEEHARWLKLAKKAARHGKVNKGGGGSAALGLVASSAAEAAASVASAAPSLSSVFGVLGKVADAGRGMAEAAGKTISDQTAKLVEQVEKADAADKLRREGKLKTDELGSDSRDELTAEYWDDNIDAWGVDYALSEETSKEEEEENGGYDKNGDHQDDADVEGVGTT